ncbi:MAG: uroporphyrinogen decarboxylase family protein, partial [Desulfatiglandales bacterium]
MAMNKRERFKAIARGERPGDVMIVDWFHRCLVETPPLWVEQGAPPEILIGSTSKGSKPGAMNEYLGFDHLHALREIVSGIHRLDLIEKTDAESFYPTPPIVPPFERKIVEEDERHRVEITFGGEMVRVSREHPWRMPEYLDHPVKDRATWKEYKWRLDPTTPERWPREDWGAFVERMNSMDAPVCLLLGGFFGTLRSMMGLEPLLFLFYDDPGLVEEMMDVMVDLEMGVAKKVFESGLKVDMIRFWEDMAYKSGPMISPEMFRRFMTPRYRKLCDYVRSQGVDLLHIDTDGNFEKLIDPWLEVGVSFHWPLEVAAGMDAVALRKKYSKELILGGNI